MIWAADARRRGGELVARARAEPPRRRAAWIATGVVLMGVPAFVNAARQAHYRTSIVMCPARAAGLAPPTNARFVSRLLRDPALREAMRHKYGLPRTGTLAGVSVRRGGLTTADPAHCHLTVIRLTATASTPIRAKALADDLALQVIGAAARGVMARARVRTAAIDGALRRPGVSQSRRVDLLLERIGEQQLGAQGAARFVLGLRAPLPRIHRRVDRIIDALPGAFPPRRSPIGAAAAGLLLTLGLWLVALSTRRWAPRR